MQDYITRVRQLLGVVSDLVPDGAIEDLSKRGYPAFSAAAAIRLNLAGGIIRHVERKVES